MDLCLLLPHRDYDRRPDPLLCAGQSLRLAARLGCCANACDGARKRAGGHVEPQGHFRPCRRGRGLPTFPPARSREPAHPEGDLQFP
eukprot:9466725-Pyramimonas_sp.AAC.1